MQTHFVISRSNLTFYDHAQIVSVRITFSIQVPVQAISQILQLPAQKPVEPKFKPTEFERKPVKPERKPIAPQPEPVEPKQRYNVQEPEKKPPEPQLKPRWKPVEPEKKPPEPQLTLQWKPVEPKKKSIEPTNKPFKPEKMPNESVEPELLSGCQLDRAEGNVIGHPSSGTNSHEHLWIVRAFVVVIQ